MVDPGISVADRQTWRFMLLYALASAGGAVAYVPFLTIILPLQVTGIAGAGALTLLAYLSFAGAIAASVSNIVFGWASDVTGDRRPWIAAGLILSCGMLTQFDRFAEPSALMASIILWQICLNMMLAPLTAWAGDHVPDGQKGMLGGLLAFTPAIGAMAGIVVTWETIAEPEQRLFWIAGLTLCCMLPVLLLGRPVAIAALNAGRGADVMAAERAVLAEAGLAQPAALRMWAARLLVQVAEASLFAFLLLWFRSIDPSFGEGRIASIFTAVLSGAVVIALFVGRWSDRHDRPMTPLFYAALGVALGLGIMAAARGMGLAIAGYALFGVAGSVFLALHSSQTLRVLRNPAQRGRNQPHQHGAIDGDAVADARAGAGLWLWRPVCAARGISCDCRFVAGGA
jgi:MFS family permease